MATNSGQDKWDRKDKDVEDEDKEDEEEEALSLCDLPVITLISHKDQDKTRKQDPRFRETQEQDFVFGSLSGLSSQEPQMCAADEVFFQGQILPLCLSPCSESGLLAKGLQTQSINDARQFHSRELWSKSMDRSSLTKFRSSSSSSSHRSQNSSSSTSSNTTTTNPRVSISKPKIRNQFHTVSSPKPQLRQSISYGNNNQASRKSSSAWEFFRLGVVPTPEIELQDLKVRNSTNRNSVSRNSSSSSSNSTSNCNNSNTKSSVKMSNKKGNHLIKQFVGKGGGLLSGCSCSAETAVQLDVTKSEGGTTNKSRNKTESATHAMKEKVVELKKQGRHNNNNSNRKKEAKKVMSRRRTFEWLKEVHASHPEEEAHLLSKS